MKRKFKIKFSSESRMLPFVYIKFPDINEPYLALVDTGSEITLIDKGIVDRLSKSGKTSTPLKSKLKLDGISGGTTEFQATMVSVETELIDIATGNSLSMVVTGATMNMESLKKSISNTEIETEMVMIIGSDTLRKMNTEVNYKNSEVIFNGVFSPEE